jgi:hypothetical protein
MGTSRAYPVRPSSALAAISADIYATTTGPYGVDRQLGDEGLGLPLPRTEIVKVIFGGHSHFDHTWDVPLWSKLTTHHCGRISTCYQAIAQGVRASKCKNVVVERGSADGWRDRPDRSLQS